MSDDALPGPDAPALPRDPRLSRFDNLVRPPQFVPVASATADVAPEAMDRLRRAGIAAHLEMTQPATGGVLFVDGADAHDARTVLATLDAGIGAADAFAEATAAQDTRSIDAAFSALVGHLDIDTTWSVGSNGRPAARPATPAEPHVTNEAPLADPDEIADAVSQRLQAEKHLDPPELREEHYEPPLPPPVPRPGAMALIAIAIIVCGIAVMAFGTALGIAPDRTLPTGIIGVLTGSALLVARLKRYREDDDDGAVL
ncbi:MAG: hypothetical protein JWN61_1487 [Pseudonocardiales bacterium]|nr:hypothetical protein [Jatrophihabitantaceae bacterium]MCW2603352.1 hypothetical protein [Pseudonocardiales bacterium]